MKPFKSCHHEGLRIFLLYNMPRYWVVRVGYHRGMFWSNLEWLSHPLAPYSEYQYFDLILSHYLVGCQEHSPMSIIHQKNSETFVMTWFERFLDPFNYIKVMGGLTSDTNFWTPCSYMVWTLFGSLWCHYSLQTASEVRYDLWFEISVTNHLMSYRKLSYASMHTRCSTSGFTAQIDWS